MVFVQVQVGLHLVQARQATLAAELVEVAAVEVSVVAMELLLLLLLIGLHQLLLLGTLQV